MRVAQRVRDAISIAGIADSALAREVGLTDDGFARRLSGHDDWTMSDLLTLAVQLGIEAPALIR